MWLLFSQRRRRANTSLTFEKAINLSTAALPLRNVQHRTTIIETPHHPLPRSFRTCNSSTKKVLEQSAPREPFQHTQRQHTLHSQPCQERAHTHGAKWTRCRSTRWRESVSAPSTRGSRTSKFVKKTIHVASASRRSCSSHCEHRDSFSLKLMLVPCDPMEISRENHTFSSQTTEPVRSRSRHRLASFHARAR